MDEKMKRLLGNNKGSGLLLVMISISFIAILATVLLGASYMNLRLKTMDSLSRSNFYSAETAMAEIEGALEEYSSTSIKEAYEVQLHNFIGSSSSSRTDLMKNTYFDSLEALLEDPSHPGKYDVAKLQGFTTKTGVKVVDYSSDPTSRGAIVVDKVNSRLTLKNVRIEYVNNSVSSSITTDIVIGLPSTRSETVGYLKYALISDEIIKVDENMTTNVNGGIYAGDKNDGGESGIQVLNGDLVVKGTGTPVISRSDITLLNDSSMRVDNGEIWTNNIVLGSTTAYKTSSYVGGLKPVSGPSLLANADTNVKGDLYLNARYSSAVFQNKYYGYGNGNMAAGAAGNSAILLNGYGSSLDMSGVNELLVGGHSYVSGGGNHTYGDISMAATGTALDVMEGESIAAKKNETIYLVNSDYIIDAVGSNPVDQEKALMIASGLTVNGSREFAKKIIKLEDPETPDTSEFVGGFQQIYEDYLDHDTPLKCFFTQNPKVVYFYYNFESQEKANLFVEDYYSNNKKGFDANLKLFLDNNQLKLNGSGARYEVLGAAIANFGGGDYSFMAGQTYNPTLSVEVGKLNDDYTSLQTFLRKYAGEDAAKFNKGYVASTVNGDNIKEDAVSTSISYAGGGASTYDMVILGETSTLGAIYLVDNEGKSPFVVKPGIRNGLIVATGDVEIQSNYAIPYNGLIMAMGKITTSGGGSGPDAANYNADESLLRSLFSLVEKDTLDRYFNEYPEGFEKDVDYDDYIGFENWVKDAEE